MTSGGSQVNAATPWAPASPYLTDIMGKAQQLYGQQAPNYANPSANFGYGQATGAVGNAMGMSTPYGSMASSLAPNTTAAIQKQLSGTPDYTAVKQSLDAANQQTWDSFNNTELPQLNQRASFLGNPSGSIKDLNWATANIGKNMDLNAQQQYLGEYDRAQAAQANAMGLGSGIIGNAGQQALQGSQLYQSLAQMPNQTLGDYASIVSGTGGKFGTDTLTNKAGAGQTAANVIGGLTAGAGLLNTLTGTPATSGIPGAAGQIGSWLGGGVNTGAIGSAAGSAAAGMGASVAPGVSAGLAGTAGDVAAANSAWLAAQPAASGIGAAGAGAAGAGAAGAGLGAGMGLADVTGSLGAGLDAAAASSSAAVGGSAAAEGGAAASGGLGSGIAAAAPWALAALAIAAPFYGATTAPVQLGAKYIDGLKADLAQPKESQAFKNAYWELSAGLSNNPKQYPAEIKQLAASLGIRPLAETLKVPGYAKQASIMNQRFVKQA